MQRLRLRLIHPRQPVSVKAADLFTGKVVDGACKVCLQRLNLVAGKDSGSIHHISKACRISRHHRNQLGRHAVSGQLIVAADVLDVQELVGRSKDLIISGGYNVYPAEIEGFLNELPGVAESAVVGVPHPDFGEVGVAVVIARPGTRPDPDALLAELKARLANFKIPKRCFVEAELPRNTMGKVQKNLLRERYTHLFSAA